MNDKLKGFLYGIATSVTFGLIPLFTLPLMQKGMTSDSILFYRFLAATLALGAMLVIKRESFRIAWRRCADVGIVCRSSIPLRPRSCCMDTR